ncbi:MAG: choice-of-anchor tandem repeat GloVer-containing protein [Bacteroidota bacterium]
MQLTEAPNGKLFGVSSGGGTSNYGTVFSYDTATNVVTNINSWTSTTTLFTKLVNHSNGLMYATYGSGSAGGDKLYSVNPTTGVYTNLYLFPTSSNGYYASTPLLAAPNGKLYGATALGGANAKGTIYSYDPATSTFAKLYDLTTATGYSINGEMVRMSNGIFYGTAQQGGYYGYGTIFSFNPTGNVFTVLYNFGTVNGSYPKGPMYLDATGKFIGTTSGGGIYSIGVLFSFDPVTNMYHKMKDFNGVDGETPLGELVAVNAGIRVNSSAGVSCPGSSVTLTATGGVSYVWQPGGLTGSSVVVNPATTTTYTATGTNASGCTKAETITVEIVTASAGPDQYICGGNNATQLNASPLGLINRPYDFAWANNYGDANTDEGFAVATDQAGNVYSSGFFQGNVYFGSYVLTSNGANADIYLIKTNPAGVVQWAVKGGGTGSDAPRDITVDSNGDIYVTGSIQGVSTFGNLSYTADNAGQAFIAKFNNAGVGQWIRLVGGSSTDIGEGIDVDKFTGDVYMTGLYRGTGVFGTTNITASVGTDYFLVKYNTAGVFQWVRTFTNSNWNDQGNGVSVDNSGNIYVTGYGAGNNLHFGSFTVNCNVMNAFVVKYNAAGTEQWVKTEGGTGLVQALDIVNDFNGAVYITGYYNGTSTFESNTLTQVGGDDLFYAKYSKTGSLLWVKTAGSAGADCGMRLAMSPLGNKILLTTFVANNCNFGTGYVISNPFASQTTALLTSDTLGNYTWSTSDFSVLVLTYEAVFDPTGGVIYGAGYFDNSTNVGPFNLTPGGGSGSDALLYKMGLPSQLSYSWAPTSNLNFSTIPNPIASPPATTVYTVSISTGACSVSDAMTVYVNSSVELGNDKTLCANQSILLDAGNPGATYLWTPGGQTTQSILIDSLGLGLGQHKFLVVVTSGGICTMKDSVTVTFNLCTGIEENNDGAIIRITPNPSNGGIKIIIPQQFGQTKTLEVFDCFGQKQFEKTNDFTDIDISFLTSGLYFLVLTNKDNERQTIKIIKE